jgi:hypothetical protein
MQAVPSGFAAMPSQKKEQSESSVKPDLRPNRSLIYFGACIIAGLRLAREKQVNVRVIPTGTAITESVDLAHEIFNIVFRKVPEKIERVH